MRFNSKLIILSLLAVFPSTLAARNDRCSHGKPGICINKNTCRSYGGTSSRGYCPFDPNNIRCCEDIPCKHNDMNGICKFTSDCNGVSYPGHCPGGSNFRCCISKASEKNQKLINEKNNDEKIKKITQNARDYLNCCKENWKKNRNRQCEKNEHVYVTKGEPKCNLFVYEVLLASDIDIGTPNKCSLSRSYLKLRNKCDRPPLAADWYAGNVKQFKYIGNSNGSYNPGDIITDGKHVGIVSGTGTTISASTAKGIVENDWGFRKGQNCSIYRYIG